MIHFDPGTFFKDMLHTRFAGESTARGMLPDLGMAWPGWAPKVPLFAEVDAANSSVGCQAAFWLWAAAEGLDVPWLAAGWAHVLLPEAAVIGRFVPSSGHHGWLGQGGQEPSADGQVLVSLLAAGLCGC